MILVLLALVAVSASPLRAAIGHPAPPPNDTFFDSATYLGDDPNGYAVFYQSDFDTFTYSVTGQDIYIYKYNFGWLYDFGGTTDSSDDAYLYDFDTDDVLYTSASLYPYFYSFNLDAFLYYSEGSTPREFYDFGTSSYFYYPAVTMTFD